MAAPTSGTPQVAFVNYCRTGSMAFSKSTRWRQTMWWSWRRLATLYNLKRLFSRRLFLCSRVERNLLAWLRSSTQTTENLSNLRRKLELINFDVALLRKNLLMGQTSKQEDANAIGGHGEGMKVGILALKRNGYNVVYHTNSERWGFKHEYDENVGEHSLVVRCTNARSTKDGCV
ncbi:hypothetical protein F5146DRAFT_1218655, partial [Armillaria mellea]